jgi:hypothetical protein
MYIIMIHVISLDSIAAADAHLTVGASTVSQDILVILMNMLKYLQQIFNKLVPKISLNFVICFNELQFKCVTFLQRQR